MVRQHAKSTDANRIRLITTDRFLSGMRIAHRASLEFMMINGIESIRDQEAIKLPIFRHPLPSSGGRLVHLTE